MSSNLHVAVPGGCPFFKIGALENCVFPELAHNLKPNLLQAVFLLFILNTFFFLQIIKETGLPLAQGNCVVGSKIQPAEKPIFFSDSTDSIRKSCTIPP